MISGGACAGPSNVADDVFRPNLLPDLGLGSVILHMAIEAITSGIVLDDDGMAEVLVETGVHHDPGCGRWNWGPGIGTEILS